MRNNGRLLIHKAYQGNLFLISKRRSRGISFLYKKGVFYISALMAEQRGAQAKIQF